MSTLDDYQKIAYSIHACDPGRDPINAKKYLEFSAKLIERLIAEGRDKTFDKCLEKIEQLGKQVNVLSEKLTDFGETIDRLAELLDETEKTSAKKEKIRMACYGAHHHVKLSNEQYKKLVDDFGEKKTAEYIRKVDEYVQLKGKPYKDYNLAIRKFLREDGARPDDMGSFVDKIMENAMNCTPKQEAKIK